LILAQVGLSLTHLIRFLVDLDDAIGTLN